MADQSRKKSAKLAAFAAGYFAFTFASLAWFILRLPPRFTLDPRIVIYNAALASLAVLFWL